jgi:MOSC domain-containing protein YiiM
MPAAPSNRFAQEAATIRQLMARHAGAGRLDWIGLRPAREAPMAVVARVHARAGQGLDGDRYASRDGKRQVTIVQAEHLPVIAALARRDGLAPALLRRNLLVSGISVLALKNQRFRIGAVLFEGTGPCEPCSKMEAALGSGGYNAMRGHGGICARVLEDGEIALGDAVAIEETLAP